MEPTVHQTGSKHILLVGAWEPSHQPIGHGHGVAASPPAPARAMNGKNDKRKCTMEAQADARF